jgi:hypothetical protein
VTSDWQRRVDEVWAAFDSYSEPEFLALIDRLAAELPAGDPRGPFQRAGAYDSTGHPDLAVPLYRRALDLGLTGSERRRAVIQLASSLRNLGQVAESVALLTAEVDAGSDELDGAVRAFLALALADAGREREAVSVALTALVPHLPRYQRSVTNYAADLLT